jgi:hypothetical protein
MLENLQVRMPYVTPILFTIFASMGLLSCTKAQAVETEVCFITPTDTVYSVSFPDDPPLDLRGINIYWQSTPPPMVDIGEGPAFQCDHISRCPSWPGVTRNFEETREGVTRCVKADLPVGRTYLVATAIGAGDSKPESSFSNVKDYDILPPPVPPPVPPQFIKPSCPVGITCPESTADTLFSQMGQRININLVPDPKLRTEIEIRDFHTQAVATRRTLVPGDGRMTWLPKVTQTGTFYAVARMCNENNECSEWVSQSGAWIYNVR